MREATWLAWIAVADSSTTDEALDRLRAIRDPYLRKQSIRLLETLRKDNSMTITKFADSVSPSSIDPAEFPYVAAYGNGRYAWPESQLARFKGHFLIGVRSGQPLQAKDMRCLDIERFDADEFDAAPFVRERKEAGHRDATLYCSLSKVSVVLTELKQAGLMLDLSWKLWLAWYWGDTVAPSRYQVLAELENQFGVSLSPGRLWACQWRNGTSFDTSVLYGAPDFTSAA